jgi:hypothetical protein
MKTFIQFTEEIANTVQNVQGLETEPVISKKTQVKYFRRNKQVALKLHNTKK